MKMTTSRAANGPVAPIERERVRTERGGRRHAPVQVMASRANWSGHD
jgi:hypothetical protein